MKYVYLKCKRDYVKNMLELKSMCNIVKTILSLKISFYIKMLNFVQISTLLT